MIEYPHIDTVFKRAPKGELLVGQWTRPEFAYLADQTWRFTEKVDGTNIRVVWTGDHVDFWGKTDQAQIPPFLLEQLQKTFGDPQVFEDAFGRKTLADHDPHFATLYGEGYGARIQKGGGQYIPDGVGFILFDVRVSAKVDNEDTDLWLEWPNVVDVARKFNVPVVPDVGMGTLHDMVALVRKGFPSIVAAGRTMAEGIVARPVVDLHDRAGRRVITKLKAKDFLRAITQPSDSAAFRGRPADPGPDG